jgi:hypothetical protein
MIVIFFNWDRVITFFSVPNIYYAAGFGNNPGYYKYKLRIIKIQFIFLFLTAFNITFYISFNVSGFVSLSLSLSIAHARTHACAHTHFNTSLFARRKLISVTVSLAEKYYSTTILHLNESVIFSKYNEQCLSFCWLQQNIIVCFERDICVKLLFFSAFFTSKRHIIMPGFLFTPWLSVSFLIRKGISTL